jgi:hypothetical protein
MSEVIAAWRSVAGAVGDEARMVSLGCSSMARRDPSLPRDLISEALTVIQPSSDFLEVGESRPQAPGEQAQPRVFLQMAEWALSRSSCLPHLRHLPDLAVGESMSSPSPVEVGIHARLGEQATRVGQSVSSWLRVAGLVIPTIRLRIPTRTGCGIDSPAG